MSGIERLRIDCDATQIHPLMKDVASNGKLMRIMICDHDAPATLPASSRSWCNCVSAPTMVLLPKET
jgi:hypothetical protein